MAGKKSTTFTFKQLDDTSASLAYRMRNSWKLKKGDTVLLLYPPGLHFLVAFMACFRAGVIGVPAYPPVLSNLKADLPKLRAILDDCGAAKALTSRDYYMAKTAFGIKNMLSAYKFPSDLELLVTDTVPASGPKLTDETVILDDLAFLQYTSGSTGTPKGNMITHGNMVHNLALASYDAGISRKSVQVSWLPQYHDMGLCSGFLAPVLRGHASVVMSPIDFIKNPMMWMQAMSDYKGTLSHAPNFGYELAARKHDPSKLSAPLDLSNVEFLMNAAEPVLFSTIEKFYATFEKYGLKRNVINPAYGLAENTVFVVSSHDGKLLSHNDRVCCGEPHLDVDIRIVDSDTLKELPDGQEGEIWINSASKARGYYRRTDNEENFEAKVSDAVGDVANHKYLRTGDLGFKMDRGLYYSGRIKDLIIIRGRNYIPSDIEAIVNVQPGIRPGCVAAFSVPGDHVERVVVVAELRATKKKMDKLALVMKIVQAVKSDVGISVSSVVLIAERTISKTTSGKIQRRKNKERYLKKEHRVVYEINGLAGDSEFEDDGSESSDSDYSENGDNGSSGGSQTDAAGPNSGNSSQVGPGSPDATSDERSDDESPVDISPDFKKLSRSALIEMSLPERINALTVLTAQGVKKNLGYVPKPNQNLIHSGITSLQAVQLVNHLETVLEMPLAATLLFECSTVAAVANHIAELVETATTYARSAVTFPDESAFVEKAGRVLEYAASPSQQRMWVAQLVAKDTSYHVPQLLHIKGRFDPSAWNKAYSILVHQHPILRTVFDAGHDGRVIDLKQRALPTEKATVKFPTVAVADVASAIKLAHADNAEVHFDLTNGPLVRGTCYKIDNTDEWVVYVNYHHIVVDEWSLGIAAKQISTLYYLIVQEGNNDESMLREVFPAPKFNFFDFTVAQQSALQEEQVASQLAFWSSHLDGVAALQLPQSKRPESASNSRVAGTCAINLSNNLFTSFKQLCFNNSATAFQGFLAAFNLLISIYAGSETDFAVGIPYSNRSSYATEDIFGFFLNTLSVRASVDETAQMQGFSAYLAKVRENVLSAFKHADVPLETVISHLAKAAGADRFEPGVHPLFQVMFVYNDATPYRTAKNMVSGCETKVLFLEPAHAKFDLTMFVREEAAKDAGAEVLIEYDASRYDPKLIRNMANHFVDIIENVAASPTAPLCKMSVTRPRELVKLESYLPGCDIPEDLLTLPAMIKKQTLATPDAIALEDEDGRVVSYAELSDLTDRVASYLLSLGLAPESLVALCVDKSIEMIVCMLGVVKAGCAYVPLDGNNPVDRNRGILTQADSRVVFTHPQYCTQFEGHGVPECLTSVFVVEKNCFKQLPQCESSEQITISHNQTAYCLFTSGTTGTPKGVQVSHKAICLSVVEHGHMYEITPQTRYMQFANYTFDVSVMDIFCTLAHGATILIAAKASLLQDLGAVMRKMRATFTALTPTVLSALLTPEDVPTLVGLGISGEAMTQQVVDTWADKVRLINAFGPTEAAVNVTMQLMKPDTVPTIIGKPLANVSVYILNRFMQPVPELVTGELYLGGPQLAKGYLNRPDLTDAAFVNHPISGERLYSTGDICCFTLDGLIDYRGRVDGQFKLRGLRLERDEIESVLLSAHQTIDKCVVIMSRKHTGHDMLIGAVSFSDLSASQNMELLSEESLAIAKQRISEAAKVLAKKLPSYMQLSAWIPMEYIPLSSSGKTDRTRVKQFIESLPNIDIGVNLDGSAAEEELEDLASFNIVRQVIGDVLKVDGHALSASSTFLGLGGDSITAIQVAAQCRLKGLDVQVEDIFQTSSLGELALRAAVGEKAVALSLRQETDGEDFDLTPIQARFFHLYPTGANQYNQSIVLRVAEAVTSSALEAALQQLVNRHAMLRCRFIQSDNGWVQQITPVDRVPEFKLPYHEVSSATEANMIIEQSQTSLDLRSGRVITAALIQNVSSGRHRIIFIAVHHLVVDLVSWRIILDELEVLLRGGELSPASSSFRTWSEALASKANGLTDITFKPAEEVSRIPNDFESAPTKVTYGGRRVYDFTLDASVTESIFRPENKYRTQPVELLLAALTLASRETFGVLKLRFDMEGHGRDAVNDATVDVSRTVGWFTNLYPVTFSSEGEIKRVIQQTKEELRHATKTATAFGLSKFIRKDPSVQNIPVASVLFNFMGRFQQLENKDLLLKLDGDMLGRDLKQQADDLECPYLFEINAVRNAGEMHISIAYSAEHHLFQTVKKLADNWTHAIHRIIDETASATDYSCFTPADFSSLGALKQDSLDKLMEQIKIVCHMRPRDVLDIQNATIEQQGLVLGHLSNPALYLLQFVIDLRGPLHVARFQQAWDKVIHDNPILKSRFVMGKEDSSLFQVLPRDSNISWFLSTSSDDAKAAVSAYCESDRLIEFSLGRPMMRLALFTVTENQFQLVWTIHHALTDGWSSPMIMGDVMAAYYNEAVPRRVQFADVVQHKQRQKMDVKFEFWKTHLQQVSQSKISECVAKPTTATNDSRIPGTHLRSLKVSVADLKRAAAEANSTISNCLRAAWAMVLYRYTRSTSITFGAVVSGRNLSLAGIETVIGPCINTIPVCLDLDASMTPRHLLDLVNEDQVKTMEHVTLPLAQILKAAGLTGNSQLFDSLLIYENYPWVEASATPRDLALNVERHSEATEYPMVLFVDNDDSTVKVEIQYDTSIFTDNVIVMLAKHFNNALSTIASQMPVMIGVFPMLDAEERIESVHARQFDLQSFTMAHHLIEEQAARVPNAVALEFDGGATMTYHKLNSKSNQLARYLISQGVQKEDLVAICIDRSFQMVIAILAIVKAGAAYVPCDSSVPIARNEVVIREAQAEILLTTAEHAPIYGNSSELNIIILDDERFPWEAQDEGNLDICGLNMTNAAYVLFSSGTTGTPKVNAKHYPRSCRYEFRSF
ncbi:hypothetical protein DFJ77DRAFT_478472 [Powellomyces hirtus]|nr:hypothetical protein DFJ77DRAFT_478472 [Powellomyces hirtus]